MQLRLCRHYFEVQLFKKQFILDISEWICKNMPARFSPGSGQNPNLDLTSGSKPWGEGGSVEANLGTWLTQRPICCCRVYWGQLSKAGGKGGCLLLTPEHFSQLLKPCLRVLCWHSALLDSPMPRAYVIGQSPSQSEQLWLQRLSLNYLRAYFCDYGEIEVSSTGATFFLWQIFLIEYITQ